MKKYIIPGLFILMIGFDSCGSSNSSSINGKWKIDGIGSTDSAAKDNAVAYGLMTMLSSGAEFEFTDSGNFNISNQGTTSVSGTYTVSSDSKTLTLKANNAEEVYELSKSSENEIMLKSSKDESVIKLKK